jgi:hypothetical protein
MAQYTPPHFSSLPDTALRLQKWLGKTGGGTARGLQRTLHVIKTSTCNSKLNASILSLLTGSARPNSENRNARKPSGVRRSEARFINHSILEIAKYIRRVLATNAVCRAHGLREARPCPPPQDLSSHRRAALPRAGSDSDDSKLSDGATSSRCCTRAVTPPIYEGGTTARTRIVAPRVCPECECEGCPGCMCMCPVSTNWIEHADGEGHFFPTCILCGGEDCPGCSCICPKSTQLKEHGGHFEG